MASPPQTLPANFSGWDQPAPGGPPATLPAGFNQWDGEKPAAPQKDFSARVGERIGQNVMAPAHILDALPHAMQQAFDQPNLPKSASDVPAYVGNALAKPFSMAKQLFADYKDDPAKLVGDVITAKVMHGVADEPTIADATPPAKGAMGRSFPLGDAVGIFSPKAAKIVDGIRAGNFGEFMPDRAQHLIKFAQKLLGNDAPPSWTPGPPEQWGKTVAPTTAAPAASTTPAWQPLQPQPVPSTNAIRDRVQAEAKIPPAGSPADLADDRATQQEMNWNLERHGFAANSEARREFIARNSTGTTKGELAKRFAAASGKGNPAEDSATTDNLLELLEKSLAQVKAQRGGK